MESVWFPSLLRGEPFVPQDDGRVLERLRPVGAGTPDAELRRLRTRLSSDPSDSALASEYVRRCLAQSRSEGDPRYLGRAQSALSPWWEADSPPPEVLVLRATVRQAGHDFEGALVDLDRLLKVDRSNAQGWLTRSAVCAVLGRHEEARRACLPLARLAPGLVAVTAAANVGVLAGDADRSIALLESTLAHDRSPASVERLWALTILGESLARRERPEAAEARFREALGLGVRDVYLLGAYADFLLDQGRSRDVVALLKDEVRVDGLLLRLALAESLCSPETSGFKSHLATLQARFEAGRLRGESVHQREQARFILHLLHHPEEALRLAESNWRVQHEPADARILVEASLAAGQPEIARPVARFVESTRLQDHVLRTLLARIAPVPVANPKEVP
jgi:Flp pilus assembly protein TadD